MATDSGSYDDATLMRRQMAMRLLGQATTPEKITHWAQGLAQLGRAALGGYMGADAENERRTKETQGTADLYTALGIPAPETKPVEPQGGFQKLAALLSGAGSSPSPATAAPPVDIPQQAPTPAVALPPQTSGAPLASADTTGKIYANDEPSPLDPPSGMDRENAIKTILGEAGNQGPLGMQAVGSVIRNRAVDGSYGGDTATGVVTAKNQFEPWNTNAGRQKMAALLNTPAAAQAGSALDKAYFGDDPTEGKTMFYSPSGQAALGRPPPAWAQGEGQKIGDHVFYDDNSGLPGASAPAGGTASMVAGPGAPSATPPAAAAGSGIMAGVPDDKKRQIAIMLSSPNPALKALGQQMLTAATTADKPVVVGGKLVNPRTGAVVYEGEDDKPKWGITGKDKYGQPIYGYPPTREEAAAAAKTAPATAMDQPDLTDVHGKEYLTALQKSDPALAGQVTAIIEGRAPYPTGMLLKTPYGQALAQHVTQADPTFEAGNATARVKVRNEFNSGGVQSPAGQITAGNTALQHAGEMSDALEKMKAQGGVLSGVGNAGIPFVSYAANKLKNASVAGTPEGAALAEFMTAKNHFSEEVTKFYAGSAGSEAERARALANLDAAKSLPELRSAIQKESDLMQGKVTALQDRWRNGMGPLVADFPLISEKSQVALDRIKKRERLGEAGAEPPAGIDPAALAEAKRRGLIK